MRVANWRAPHGRGAITWEKGDLELSMKPPLNKTGLMQLQKEIDIYRQYEHENIVRYLGTNKVGKKLYLFLEFMPGGSLKTLYKKKKMTDLEVSTITRQILNVLKFLHDHKVIHRDIKCENILVGESGSVKLADFGLAKITSL